VRVVKNKVAPPFKVAEFDIMYNEGISKVGDVLDLGVQFEELEKRGSYYSYGETRIGQGRENAKDFLRANPEIAEAVELAIRKKADFVSVSEPDTNQLSEDSSDEMRE